MPVPIFYELLKKVTPIIARQDTSFRQAISPGARQEATLRFLATGQSSSNMQYSKRISRHALRNIIPETCDAIYRVLQDDYIKVSIFKTPNFLPKVFLFQAKRA